MTMSDPLSEKLTIFTIWPNLKLSIFCHLLIWPKLLYLGIPEDSWNGVGAFFAHKVMQILNLESVFESERIWNFSFCACANLLLTSPSSVTLRIQKCLSIQFWSLSDPVSENRVRFARSIKKYFHFCSKSVEKWHLLSLSWKFFSKKIFFKKNFFLRIV